MSSRQSVACQLERMLLSIEKLHSNEGHGVVRQPIFLRTIKNAREQIFNLCRGKQEEIAHARDAAGFIADFDKRFSGPDWPSATVADWNEFHQKLQSCSALVEEHFPENIDLQPCNRITRYYSLEE